MTRLIGWSDAAGELPDGCRSLAAGRLYAIGLEGPGETEPRNRLAAMLDCANGLSGFLPARAANDVDLDAAAEWTRDNRAELTRRLSRVRGRLQMTLLLELPANRRPRDAPANGRCWLAERRAVRAEAEARRQEAALHLARLAAGVPECGWRERRTARSACLDLLLNREQVPQALEVIETGFRQVPAGLARALTVAGPWPPVSFAWET